MKKYRLLLLIVFCIPSVRGMQEHQNNKMVNLFLLSTLNRWFARPFYQVFFPDLNHEVHENAGEEYQKLGKQFYDQLHVSPHERLPIKKIKGHRGLAENSNIVGIATPHAIFIKEEYLDNSPYSVKKHVLLHEVAHVKYYDNVGPVLIASGSIASLGVSVGAAIGSLGLMMSSIKYPQNLQRSYRLFFIGGATGSFGVIGINNIIPYQSYAQESRAEKTAIYGLNCYQCVDEIKNMHGNRNASIIEKGYWSAEQMQKVVDAFKQQNKLCSDHEKQMANSDNLFQKIRTWIYGS